MDSKAVRVCDTCYTKLNENGTPREFRFDVGEENRCFSLLEIRPNQRDSSDSDGDDSSGHVSGTSVSLTEKSMIDVVSGFS